MIVLDMVYIEMVVLGTVIRNDSSYDHRLSINVLGMINPGTDVL